MRINPICNTQQQNSKKQNINFGINAMSVKPGQIIDKEGIFRRNMFGLQIERIDFFKGTKKIQQHFMQYLPRKGNPGPISIVDFSLNGSKKVTNKQFNSKFCYGNLEVEDETRHYVGKKLISKTRKYHSKDKIGEYYAEMNTTYHQDGKTISEVIQSKWYKYEDEDGYIRYKKPSKLTIKFDESGTKISETRPTSYGWKTKIFDEKGNVIDTQPGGHDKSISYYGQFGYYTPETGMQMHSAS